ncbi:cysteine--tRNA ligase [Salinispirillum sp. LH 10-3-1]|uniref:Cysteine--tRNA ligase n=1 Tax=Salinispirillum sp. LH 10-3-1 TaxID=2952525 RepID=A0AB38YBM2_9GAMM
MPIQIYNSLTNRKETFVPLKPERITMYVCGPTVYNYIHIGNARPAVVFDTFARVLRLFYPQLDYARNITDIDDKINNAAHTAGEDIGTYSARYTEAYRKDMASLFNLPPTVEPLATEHIDVMVELIDNLIQRGFAYAAEGHVLFDVAAMPDYGKLSKRKTEDMIAGARVEVASYKKNPMDFVLWKPSVEAHEPGWESPWGYGRPGWHIECTAMINKHLGPTIDIHGGGADLMFPHHENEVAQGTCCHSEEHEYVRYWMHNGMININGEKMSKSLNNFITVHELLESYPGELLRLALLSGQYRSLLNWSDDLLNQSRMTLDRFYGALRDTATLPEVDAPDLRETPVVQALCDDMNSPLAIAELHGLVSRIYQDDTTNEDKAKLRAELIACGRVLGLFNYTPVQWFQELSAQDNAVTPEQIEALIALRTAAKKAKDFAEADRVRAELDAAGVEIQDTREGTRWQWK